MDDEVEVTLPATLLPGYESRLQALAIIKLTLLVPAILAFLFIASPGTMGARYEPRLLDVIVPLAGVAMFLFGLAWMIRIYRAAIDVEPDHGNWRYRSR